MPDGHGRKALLQIAILIFATGSLAAGLSQSMVHLITARAVQGVLAGGSWPEA